MLLLAPNAFDPLHREILFIREPNEHLAIWEGHKHTKEEATAISGIANVKWLSEFPGIFRQLACEMKTIYLNSNEHQRADVTVETRDNRFVRTCQSQFPLHQYQRLAPLMHELRAVKSQYEVDAIQAACNLTGKGFVRVCKFLNSASTSASFTPGFRNLQTRTKPLPVKSQAA